MKFIITKVHEYQIEIETDSVVEAFRVANGPLAYEWKKTKEYQSIIEKKEEKK